VAVRGFGCAGLVSQAMIERFRAPGTGSPQTQHFSSFLVTMLLQSGHRELQLGMRYFERSGGVCPWTKCTDSYCAFGSKVSDPGSRIVREVEDLRGIVTENPAQRHRLK
jgi:hypothetical protein